MKYVREGKAIDKKRTRQPEVILCNNMFSFERDARVDVLDAVIHSCDTYLAILTGSSM